MSTLVVAFDGLDYDLIQKYSCNSLAKMAEFGKIDNYSGITKIATSEEFASFITGTTSDDHGVKGLESWDKKWRGRLIDILTPELLKSNVRGFVRLNRVLKAAFGCKKLRTRKEDLDSETIFEKVKPSKPLFVPAYNPSWNWIVGAGTKPLQYGASREETAENWNKDFEYRKKSLFRTLDNDYKFIMVHFQKPDIIHHLYAYDGVKHPKKVKALYQEMNGLTQKIKQKAKGNYDTLIFMSDHGLPTEKEHNTNAFYSCNRELFGEKEPHITDFYDKIIENEASQKKDDLTGLSI